MTSATEKTDWRTLYEAYFGPIDAEVADTMASEIKRINPTRGQVDKAIRNLGDAGHHTIRKPRAGEILREIRNIMAESTSTMDSYRNCVCNDTGWLDIFDNVWTEVMGQSRIHNPQPASSFAVYCPNCDKGRAWQDAAIKRADGNADKVMDFQTIRRLWAAQLRTNTEQRESA